jgi:hypothetical protein
MITVDYMVVADAANVAEMKHYILGAGWDSLIAPTFPVTVTSIAVAILLRVPWNDANFPTRVEVDILDEDGHSILPNPPGPLGGIVTIGRAATVPQGSDMVQPLVFNLSGVVFNRAGDYVVVTTLNGGEAKRYPIHLIQRRAGQL